MAEAKTTTDRETIRRRAGERGGKPAVVRETGGNGDPGILRIDFPGRGDDDRLEQISWEGSSTPSIRTGSRSSTGSEPRTATRAASTSP